MSRINMLRLKLLVSGFHALILLGPIALASIVLEKVADGANWLSDKLDTVCAMGGAVLLPKWWPSHKILKALNYELWQRRQSKVDELHK